MMKFLYSLFAACALSAFYVPTALAQNADYSELSTTELEAKAKAGDAHAYYSLGSNLLFEAKTADVKLENLESALKHIRKADALGHDEAPSVLALYYFGDFGGDKKPKKAKEALLRGIDRGGPGAKLNFGVRFINSEISTESTLAKKLLTEMSLDPKLAGIAAPELMQIYSFGNASTDVDLEKGRQYAKLCSDFEQEYAQCNFLYARYLLNGWGGEKNLEDSTFHFKRAAEAGDERAQWNYGISLIEGRGTPINLEEAYQWMRKSANNDYLDGLISFAVMNAIGQGTVINNELAYASYEKAAKRGSAHALRGMSLMIMEGQGTPKNKKLGLAALLVAYEKGERNAGQLLNYLLGNPQNLQLKILELRNELAAEITKINGAYDIQAVE